MVDIIEHEVWWATSASDYVKDLWIHYERNELLRYLYTFINQVKQKEDLNILPSLNRYQSGHPVYAYHVELLMQHRHAEIWDVSPTNFKTQPTRTKLWVHNKWKSSLRVHPCFKFSPIGFSPWGVKSKISHSGPKPHLKNPIVKRVLP